MPVVFGAVIDPEMSEGIRVTVVATGLGQSAGFTHQPVRGKEPASPSEMDYVELEKPAITRKRNAGNGVKDSPKERPDLLDIPAFLRRQAD